MKLLFDERLSPRLAIRLADLFPGSTHVFDRGLGAVGDDVIWAYAAAHGFAVVSHDEDVFARSLLLDHPPKLPWINTGNCPTAEVERVIRAAHGEILRFAASAEESAVILP